MLLLRWLLSVTRYETSTSCSLVREKSDSRAPAYCTCRVLKWPRAGSLTVSALYSQFHPRCAICRVVARRRFYIIATAGAAPQT